MISCVNLAYSLEESVYLRMGKSDVGDIHQDTPQLKLGDLLPIKVNKSNIHFIATGSMVKTAVTLAEEFEVSVSSAPCLKPINKEQVSQICQRNEIVVTLEEHSIFGGLGSIVSEIASEISQAKVLRIGVEDRFTKYCGTYNYLLKEQGLDLSSDRSKIKNFLKKA